jgi:hypothetical protein
MPRPLYSREIDAVSLVQQAELAQGCGKFLPLRVRSPDPPVRSQSLVVVVVVVVVRSIIDNTTHRFVCPQCLYSLLQLLEVRG